MSEWQVTGLRDIAEGTIELSCAPPKGECSFDFVPGQFVEISLPGLKSDPRGPAREFSIANAPDEPGITIITRLSQSPYKQALAALTLRDTVNLVGPYGRFTLDTLPILMFPSYLVAGEHEIVFVASGVGIAPFVSMLRHMKRVGFPCAVTLFFKTKSRARAPYLGEMEELARVHPELTLVVEAGDVFHETLARLATNANPLVQEPARYFFMAGGPHVMRAAYDTLRANGVLNERIYTEEFSGY